MLSKGRKFEIFCCGQVPTCPYSPITRRKRFDEVLAGSIKQALKIGLDQKKLEEEITFFWRVFCEVKQHIPRKFRRFLRVIVTIGTELDYHQGCDVLFVLGRKAVPIDLTLILGKDLNSMIYANNSSLIFHHQMLGDKSMATFAKKVAKMLMDTDLGITVPDNIYNQYRAFLYKPTTC